MKIYFIFLFFIVFPLAYADEIIPITQSSGMTSVIFDGKWSNELEWKPSALYDLRMNNSTIHFRSAHQNNFIYVLIDAVPDIRLTNSDYAMICFDTNNDKSKNPNNDDYCFSTFLNEKPGITFQGNGNKFIQIQNYDDFIAIGAISDHNDRYSKTPHASYEFKIPLDLIGRTDAYGFYFMVNDDQNYEYFWPMTDQNPRNSPDKWGILVSPDKSLPEFNLAYLILILSLLVIMMTSKYSTKLFSFNNSSR